MSKKMQIFHQLDENIAETILAHFYQDRLYLSCYIVKLSQSLNLSLSLRDRADTIITFHPPPPSPPETFQEH